MSTNFNDAKSHMHLLGLHGFTATDLRSLWTNRKVIADAILHRCLGSHALINAFDGIDFSYSSCISSPTVSDIMHSLESGIIKLITSVFLDPLPPSSQRLVDSIVHFLFGMHDRNSVSSLYPRLSFQKGFSTLTQLSSSERVGRIFVITILLWYEGLGQWLFDNRFSVKVDNTRRSQKKRKKGRKQPLSNKRRHANKDINSGSNVASEGDSDSTGSDLDGVTDNEQEVAIGDDDVQPGLQSLTDEGVETILLQLDLGCLTDSAWTSLPTFHSALKRQIVQSLLPQRNNRLMQKLLRWHVQHPDQ
jgi:hypothetical protein